MSVFAATLARLRATVMPPFRLIDGAAEFAALKSAPRALPALYLLPLVERPSENRIAAGASVRQRVSAELGVLIVAGSVADPRGEAAATSLAGLRQAVRDDALLGWMAEGADAGFELGVGELVDVIHGCVWWQDRYRYPYYARKL